MVLIFVAVHIGLVMVSKVGATVIVAVDFVVVVVVLVNVVNVVVAINVVVVALFAVTDHIIFSCGQ